jgi:hypothetical protein
MQKPPECKSEGFLKSVAFQRTAPSARKGGSIQENATNAIRV